MTARTTPEGTFAEARAAMERGDWDAFFACIDRHNLLRIAENGVGRFLMAGETEADVFAGICARHGVPDDAATRLRALLQGITDSAAQGRSIDGRADPAAMLQDSLRHKRVVDDYREALKETIKGTTDLAGFAAALERALRAAAGGGSVSSRLLVGETLEDVTIAGSKARATRRLAEGQTEEVTFVRRKGGVWYVRIFR